VVARLLLEHHAEINAQDHVSQLVEDMGIVAVVITFHLVRSAETLFFLDEEDSCSHRSVFNHLNYIFGNVVSLVPYCGISTGRRL